MRATHRQLQHDEPHPRFFPPKISLSAPIRPLPLHAQEARCLKHVEGLDRLYQGHAPLLPVPPHYSVGTPVKSFRNLHIDELLRIKGDAAGEFGQTFARVAHGVQNL